MQQTSQCVTECNGHNVDRYPHAISVGFVRRASLQENRASLPRIRDLPHAAD